LGGWNYILVIVDMLVGMVLPGVAKAVRAGASVLLVHRPGPATAKAES
jgi:hypothetical protein